MRDKFSDAIAIAVLFASIAAAVWFVDEVIGAFSHHLL